MRLQLELITDRDEGIELAREFLLGHFAYGGLLLSWDGALSFVGPVVRVVEERKERANCARARLIALALPLREQRDAGGSAMTSREADTIHPVARVYYAEPQRGQSEQRWVRCERHESSVPLEQCARCPHLREITSDAQGRVVEVHCPGPFADGGESAARPLQLPRLPVSDLMTRNVLCVRPTLSLDALIELFVQTGLKAVPVVDPQGVLVGIASESDALLDVHATGAVKEEGHVEGMPRARGSPRRPRDAQSVMSPRPLTLQESTAVTRAAAVMVFEQTSRAVVVSTHGEIVGMLSASDILLFLARADGYMLGHGARESP